MSEDLQRIRRFNRIVFGGLNSGGCLDRQCDCGPHRACTCGNGVKQSHVQSVKVSTGLVILLNGETTTRDISNKVSLPDEPYVFLIDGLRMTVFDKLLNRPVVTGKYYKELSDQEVVVEDLNEQGLLLIIQKAEDASIESLKIIEKLEYWDRKDKELKTVQYYQAEKHNNGWNYRNNSPNIFVYNNERFTLIYVKHLNRNILTKLESGEFIVKASNKFGYKITNFSKQPF